MRCAAIQLLTILIFFLTSFSLYAEGFFKNDILSVRGTYYHPLPELSDIMDYGYGGEASYTIRDFLFMNFNLGLLAGYGYFPGKIDRVDKMHHIPMLMTLGYRIHLFGPVSFEPIAAAGSAYNIIYYAENDAEAELEGFRKNAAFEVMARGGGMFHINLGSSYILQIGADYNAIFEKEESRIIDFVNVSTGIGIRFGDGYPVERLDDMPNITVKRNRNISLSVSMEKVRFKANRAELTENIKKELVRVASVLKRYKKHHITIIGHAASIGRPKRESKISLKRARVVKRYLSKKYGFQPKKIKIIGKGSTEPIADNKTDEGKARNRRVEIIVHGK